MNKLDKWSLIFLAIVVGVLATVMVMHDVRSYKGEDFDAEMAKKYEASANRLVVTGNVAELEFMSTTNGWRCADLDADLLSEEFFYAIGICSSRVKKADGSQGGILELRIKIPKDFPSILLHCIVTMLMHNDNVRIELFYLLDDCIIKGTILWGALEEQKFRNVAECVKCFQRSYMVDKNRDQYPVKICKKVKIYNEKDENVDDNTKIILINKSERDYITVCDYLQVIMNDEYIMQVFFCCGGYLMCEFLDVVDEYDAKHWGLTLPKAENAEADFSKF